MNRGNRSRGFARRNGQGVRRPVVVGRVVRPATVNGSELRTRNDPKAIIENPWNQAVLEFGYQFPDDSGHATVTILSMVERINQQLGLTSVNSGELELRFMEIRVWNLSEGVIQVEPSDLIEYTTGADEARRRPLKTIKDFPGRNHWASVGFMWPKAHQSIVTASSATTRIIASITAEPSNNVLVRVNTLYRGVNRGTAALRAMANQVCHGVQNLSIVKISGDKPEGPDPISGIERMLINSEPVEPGSAIETTV